MELTKEEMGKLHDVYVDSIGPVNLQVLVELLLERNDHLSREAAKVIYDLDREK